MINQHINIGQNSAMPMGVGASCVILAADYQSITPPVFCRLISSLAEGVKEIVGIAEHSVMPVVACANL